MTSRHLYERGQELVKADVEFVLAAFPAGSPPAPESRPPGHLTASVIYRLASETGGVQGIGSIEMISCGTTPTQGSPAILKLGGSTVTSVAVSTIIPSVASR